MRAISGGLQMGSWLIPGEYSAVNDGAAMGSFQLFTNDIASSGTEAVGSINQGGAAADYAELQARGTTIANPTGSARVRDLLEPSSGDLSYFPPQQLVPIGAQPLTDIEMAELSGRVGFKQGLEVGAEIVQMTDGSEYYLVKGVPNENGWMTKVPQDPGWIIESHVHPNWSGASEADLQDLAARNQSGSRIVHPERGKCTIWCPVIHQQQYSRRNSSCKIITKTFPQNATIPIHGALCGPLSENSTS